MQSSPLSISIPFPFYSPKILGFRLHYGLWLSGLSAHLMISSTLDWLVQVLAVITFWTLRLIHSRRTNCRSNHGYDILWRFGSHLCPMTQIKMMVLSSGSICAFVWLLSVHGFQCLMLILFFKSDHLFLMMVNLMLLLLKVACVCSIYECVRSH